MLPNGKGSTFNAAHHSTAVPLPTADTEVTLSHTPEQMSNVCTMKSGKNALIPQRLRIA